MVDDCLKSLPLFSFVSLAEIGDYYDNSYFVGFSIGARIEREYERNDSIGKMNEIELGVDGQSPFIDCTLFELYVDELNLFLRSSDVQHPIFERAKTFKGKTYLQNVMNCTKLIFNPQYSKAINFKNKISDHSDFLLSQLPYSSRVSIDEDGCLLSDFGDS
ncbi:hypothetical protein CR513_03042, partial [Mucuna pruriens]